MLDAGLVLVHVIMLLIRLVLMIKMEHPAAQFWFPPSKKKKKNKKNCQLFADEAADWAGDERGVQGSFS